MGFDLKIFADLIVVSFFASNHKDIFNHFNNVIGSLFALSYRMH